MLQGPVPAGYKRCGRCHSVLPFGAFAKAPARFLGLSSYCKPCKVEYAKERYADANNDTKRLAWLMRQCDGISLQGDRHALACEYALLAGREQATPGDELRAFRVLIDRAMESDIE